jgi:hypothetical protein
LALASAAAPALGWPGSIKELALPGFAGGIDEIGDIAGDDGLSDFAAPTGGADGEGDMECPEGDGEKLSAIGGADGDGHFRVRDGGHN